MKYLIVGDYHAEQSDLRDCEDLADYIVELSVKHKAKVLFMGDQYHNHGVISAEVQRFWCDFFDRLPYGSISLVGNHDKPGSANSMATAMLAHTKQTTVVREPTLIDGALFLPYMHSAEEFVDTCKKYPHIQTVICHQTFDGSKYENGFYAQDGVDPELIPQESVVSGHIHTPQEFGKVWYVGAPRWRTISDAGIDRNIWVVCFDEAGAMLERKRFSTGNVCRQIIQLVDTEERPGSDLFLAGHDYRVDIHGHAGFIEQRAAHWKALGARVRTFQVDEAVAAVSESEGLETAFQKYVEGFKANRGTDIVTLKSMLKERVSRAI